MSKRTAQNTLPGLRPARGPIYIAAPGGREDRCWQDDRDPQAKRWAIGTLRRRPSGPVDHRLRWGSDLAPGCLGTPRGSFLVRAGDLLLMSAPWAQREALAGQLARLGWGPVYYDGREYKLSRVEGAA